MAWTYGRLRVILQRYEQNQIHPLTFTVRPEHQIASNSLQFFGYSDIRTDNCPLYVHFPTFETHNNA